MKDSLLRTLIRIIITPFVYVLHLLITLLHNFLYKIVSNKRSKLQEAKLKAWKLGDTQSYNKIEKVIKEYDESLTEAEKIQKEDEL